MLYLQVRIGEGRYLLDAARVADLRTGEQRAPSALDQATPTVPVVDLRKVLGTGACASGHLVLYDQAIGKAALLVVDYAEGLLDLADDELCPLPPIGPLGGLVDAVSTRLVERRPMLRLRAERALDWSAEPASSASAADR